MFRVTVHNYCLLKETGKISVRFTFLKCLGRSFQVDCEEVSARDQGSVSQDWEASDPQCKCISLLLKELTPDIVDRLRDGSSPPADRR